MFSKNLSGINNLTNINNITATGDIETNTIELSPAIYLSGLTSNIQNQFNTISSNIIYNYNNQNNINTYNNSYLNSLSSYIVYKLPNIFHINNVYSYSYGTLPTVDFQSISGYLLMNFGIPAGATGATGATGPKGDTGSSADASSAKASTGLLGIMSGVGFAATGLSLGVLQTEIAGLITQVSQIEATILTMQSTINILSNYVEELQKKCRHIDANRDPTAVDVSSLNSQLNIKSHTLIGTSGKGTTQVTIDGTLNTKSDVKIQGNLIVYGSINYSNAPSKTVPPLIQFDF
jgi:hypothetical protein